jgi:hypothetical protein
MRFIVVRMLLMLPLAVFLAGCGQTGPARGPIQGKITVGGQPLSAGHILFTPVAPNKGPATSARITAGEYKLPKSEGPVIGQNLVQVEADLNPGFAIDDEAAFAKRGGKPLPPNPIPIAFNKHSTLTVEVKAGEQNQFDVAIPGRNQATASR